MAYLHFQGISLANVEIVYNIISVHTFILRVSYLFTEVRPWGYIHRGQKVEVLAEPGSPQLSNIFINVPYTYNRINSIIVWKDRMFWFVKCS